MTQSISPLFSPSEHVNLLMLLEREPEVAVGGPLMAWLRRYCPRRVGAASIRPGDGRIVVEGSQ